MMFCPQCGVPNEDDSVFCGNCGAVLDVDAVPAETVDETPLETGVEAEEAMPDIPSVGEPFVGEPSVGEPSVGEPSVGEIAVASPPSPPPPSAYAPAPSAPTSGLAIASLVLGIGGLTILPLLGSIVAIVLGYMARKDIRQRPDEVSGDALALAGIVLGWISVGLAVLGFLALGGLGLCGVCGALGTSG